VGVQVNPLEGKALETLGRHVMKESMLSELNEQDLSNIIWSCGVLGISPCHGDMLLALADAVSAKAGGVSQQVCTTGSMPCTRACTCHRMRYAQVQDGVSVPATLTYAESTFSPCQWDNRRRVL
jgi:hypothetical protein